MALEFNADRQIIKSDNLNLKGSQSVRIDIGSSADEKVGIFGTLTSDADALVRIGINTLNPIYELDVEGAIRTTTSIISDTARIANLDIDTIINPELNLRAPVLNSFTDPNTGQIFFPRSATPAFNDDSDKIATTNFVYNIATNDVGGRIYVSAQIGSDTFDGRSATKPVRTIKRATQLAAETGDKETLIVAGGDYLEDNPISLPDLCSVVGDNIRLCIIRPRNAGKHMFKASNENYVTGITFRDQVDDKNNAIKTWGYAYVFDDKQRFYYPKTLGGQFGRTFELGHKIAAPQRWQLTFTSNGGGVLLVPGLVLTNTTTSGTGVISEVNFDLNTDQTGTVVIDNITGTIESIGAIYQYDANDPVVTYDLSVSGAELLTPDAQVVKHQTTHQSYGIASVTYDPDNYPNGLIFNLPTNPATYHDYEVGQYVEISNLPNQGQYLDLDRFNGRQYISHRIETDDGFSTKFVVFKDTPTDLIALGAPGGTLGVSSFAATVTSADHYVVFSLDNSPRKFEESTKSPNRYLDAVDLIERNKEGIAAEALRRAKVEYPSLVVPDETQCKTDVKHIVDAINYDLTWGGNAATKEAAENYYTGGALDHIAGQLKETTYAFEQARDLSILAMRNRLRYLDTGKTGSVTRPAQYTQGYNSGIIWDNEKFLVGAASGEIHTSTDGKSWTRNQTPIPYDIRDIIFSKDAVGQRGVPEYVAVGLAGSIGVSADGITWYNRSIVQGPNFSAIAKNGSTYVVVGNQGGQAEIITSQNTTTWTPIIQQATVQTLHDIIYDDDHDQFIAVGNNGIIIYSRDNGATWSSYESGTTVNLTSITWSEGKIVVGGDAGTVVTSDDGGLTWETRIATSNVEADRYQDAADLILENKKLIAAQAVYSYLNATSFVIPKNGNQDCVDDVVDVLEAIAHDLRHGGNAKTYDAASYYVGTVYVDGEEGETVAIINNARDLAKDAMRNIPITLSYLTDSGYASGLEEQFTDNIAQFTKLDISLDGSDPATACADVASSIDTLATIVTTAVTNDNLNHATRTAPTNSFNTPDNFNNPAQFRRLTHDGKRFWGLISEGGVNKLITSEDRGVTWQLEYTSTGNSLYSLGFSYIQGTVLGFSNADEFGFDGGTEEFDPSIGIYSYEDTTISNTYDANRFFACDNVSNSLYTLWNIVIDRINGRTLPATTFASSSYLDSNNKFFNVGHSYDDLPIIEVSPYIFNSSVISFLGGGGCEIDGNKVATPNVRRPNLPPQGKSMVAAAFTIISFGGTGYRVINDGYTQLVSVFCIFTQDGAIVESGGYASLTNSASNFGTFSLRASGVREEAYSFDKGTIDNITFNDIGVPIFRVENLGSPPLEHYIIEPTGFELQVTPGDQNPRYFIEETITSTTLAPITAEILANRAMVVRGNFNRYTDAAVLLENNARYIAEEAYFSTTTTSLRPFDQNRDKCIRDVEEIVKAWAQDIKYDANDATWDAAKLYVGSSSIQHIAGYEAATQAVIDTATTLAKKAINNLLVIKGGTISATQAFDGYYVAEWTDEIPYTDSTIIHDVSSPLTTDYNSNDCANVQFAIQTLSDLFDEIIDNPAIESPFFVGPVAVERNDGFFTINAFNKDKLVNHPIDLKRPSICNSSSHTWEFSGSGNDYNALPQNGGKRGSENTKDFEQVSQNNGRVYASGTDELGDFKIGYFAKVENRTGNITFGGTVEISEVSFLKITGNDVVITGFSPDNTLGALELGGPGAKDELLPTQKAVKDYISNQLGIYIGRTYSTVPTPNALVQLDGSGRINIDQLPALRPFNIFTVVTEADRLALEGPLAGDIVIETASQTFQIGSTGINTTADQIIIVDHELTTSDVVTYFQGTSPIGNLNDGAQYYAIVIDADTIQLALSVTDAVSGTQIDLTSQGSGIHTFETQGIPISYILNNDLESQILEFEPDANHTFSNGDITLATPGGGQGQVTNFLEGTVKQVVINNGGTGYVPGDNIVFTTPSGGVAAVGTLTINSGVITAVTLSNGGSQYFTAPSTAAGTITINSQTGSNATLTSIIRSRLSIDILNNIKTEVTDTIDDKSTPANTITLTDVINTSGFNIDNWIQLTSSTIDSSFITSGVISVARLASISPNYPASSLTYLRGDSRFAPAVSSIRQTAGSPIVLGSNNTASDYIAQILIEDGGQGYTLGTYTDTELLGGNSGAEGLKGTIYVVNDTVAKINITNGGQGYTDDVEVIFKDGFTNPNAPAYPILTSIKAKAVVTGGAIVGVYILDGGANLGGTPIVEFDGTGVDATATCVVRDGAIRTVTITDGGVNYNADFTITPNPAIIGTSPTTAAVLRADLATIPKIFNDTFIDINRVDGLTVAADPFSNLGVVRVRKSQFNFFSNGGIELKTGEGSGLDADTLDLKDSTFFTNASNLNAGTVPAGRLNGEVYQITNTGSSGSSGLITPTDATSSLFAPENYGESFRLQLKRNDQGYAAANEYLLDGGIYHSLLTTRRAGSSTDFAFGAVSQIAQTDNNNIWIRNSGPNHVGSIAITQAGSGYVNGTYTDIPLGGGEGVGLRATLVITNGGITSVTITDRGWGYNNTGEASEDFQATLPEEIFGVQNSRRVTTPAILTATLAFLGSGSSTGNQWSSWRKLWHDGNDGAESGLDADLFQNHNPRWFKNILNLNENTILNNNLPVQMEEHSFNKEIRVTVPSPLFQTNNGGHYDIYIEGYNLTSEVLSSLDVDALVGGIQLNLYTANNVAEGRVRVIARRINLDPANYLSGTQYVETNTEWTAGASGYDRNDRIVYGNNIYRIANANTGNYTSGTAAPVHQSGTVTATGGTAQYEFERKVDNPWTILTVEVINGNLNDTIKKIGTATAPAEYYPVSGFGIASTEAYSRRKARMGSDATGTAFLELGNIVESTTPYIDFNSSNNNVDYDVRLSASGGSSTVGTGTFNVQANNLQVNGNNAWHAGNITFGTGVSGTAPALTYDTGSNSKGVLRTADGDFGGRYIVASEKFVGTATGNLASSGGTMTGNITFDQDQQGIAWARNTDGASIKFYNTGDGDTDSRLEFQTNDNNNEYFRWTHAPSGGTVYESMRLTSVSDNNALLRIGGNLQVGKAAINQSIRIKGQYNDAVIYNTDDDTWVEARKPDDTVVGRMGFNGYSSADARYSWFELYTRNTSNSFAKRISVNEVGNIGLQGNPDNNYAVTVNGSFAATSKSFLIDHPTKEGFKLAYGSLEGPEHGVYVRGRVTDGVIELPEYWTALVDEETITVQLTAIGDSGNRWVIDVADNKITTGGGVAFYFVQAERKDVNRLEVEVEV
jgi:photosystem II stability/assembly factor-like uncharacterized protein